MTTLVYAPSWLGDTVLALPALRALRAAAPAAPLAVLARPGVDELVAASGVADEVLVYDPEGADRGVRGLLRTARRLRARRFSRAVVLPNAFRAAALVWLARIPERWGYATDGRGLLLTRPVPPAPRPFGRHQVHYYLDLLRALGVAANGAPDARLAAPPARRVEADGLLAEAGWRGREPLVGVHPGSANDPAKRWPAERFAATADRLAAALGGRVVLLGGPEDDELVARVRAALPREPILLAGRTSVGVLLGVLARLRLLLANDSGPMHLAAALGVPTLAVFGPTDERETGPFGPRARVVRRAVDCSPCLLSRCPIDHRCMVGLDEDRVFEEAVSLLAESEPAAGVGAARR